MIISYILLDVVLEDDLLHITSSTKFCKKHTNVALLDLLYFHYFTG